MRGSPRPSPPRGEGGPCRPPSWAGIDPRTPALVGAWLPARGEGRPPLTLSPQGRGSRRSTRGEGADHLRRSPNPVNEPRTTCGSVAAPSAGRTTGESRLVGVACASRPTSRLTPAVRPALRREPVYPRCGFSPSGLNAWTYRSQLLTRGWLGLGAWAGLHRRWFAPSPRVLRRDPLPRGERVGAPGPHRGRASTCGCEGCPSASARGCPPVERAGRLSPSPLGGEGRGEARGVRGRTTSGEVRIRSTNLVQPAGQSQHRPPGERPARAGWSGWHVPRAPPAGTRRPFARRCVENPATAGAASPRRA